MSKQRWEQFCPNCESLMMGEDECWRCKVPTIEVVPLAEVERLRGELVQMRTERDGLDAACAEFKDEIEAGRELAKVMKTLADINAVGVLPKIMVDIARGALEDYYAGFTQGSKQARRMKKG